MTRSIELVEKGIIKIAWNGVVNRANYTQGITDRIAFADANQIERYVLIFDLRKALVTVFDFRLAAWSVDADPRMKSTVIIGNSTLVRVTVNTILRMTKTQLVMVQSEAQALERARHIVAGWETEAL